MEIPEDRKFSSAEGGGGADGQFLVMPEIVLTFPCLFSIIDRVRNKAFPRRFKETLL